MTRIWMQETVRMILIPINTTNCRTALECTQLIFVWILTEKSSI
jgi:hypothetical protein